MALPRFVERARHSREQRDTTVERCCVCIKINVLYQLSSSYALRELKDNKTVGPLVSHLGWNRQHGQVDKTARGGIHACAFAVLPRSIRHLATSAVGCQSHHSAPSSFGARSSTQTPPVPSRSWNTLTQARCTCRHQASTHARSPPGRAPGRRLLGALEPLDRRCTVHGCNGAMHGCIGARVQRCIGCVGRPGFADWRTSSCHCHSAPGWCQWLAGWLVAGGCWLVAAGWVAG